MSSLLVEAALGGAVLCWSSACRPGGWTLRFARCGRIAVGALLRWSQLTMVLCSSQLTMLPWGIQCPAGCGGRCCSLSRRMHHCGTAPTLAVRAQGERIGNRPEITAPSHARWLCDHWERTARSSESSALAPGSAERARTGTRHGRATLGGSEARTRPDGKALRLERRRGLTAPNVTNPADSPRKGSPDVGRESAARSPLLSL